MGSLGEEILGVAVLFRNSWRVRRGIVVVVRLDRLALGARDRLVVSSTETGISVLTERFVH